MNIKDKETIIRLLQDFKEAANAWDAGGIQKIIFSIIESAEQRPLSSEAEKGEMWEWKETTKDSHRKEDLERCGWIYDHSERIKGEKILFWKRKTPTITQA